jgi:hypothetical protein
MELESHRRTGVAAITRFPAGARRPSQRVRKRNAVSASLDPRPTGPEHIHVFERRHLAVAGLPLVLSGAVWVFADLGWRVIRFPYPVDYGEGPLLEQAVRLAPRPRGGR